MHFCGNKIVCWTESLKEKHLFEMEMFCNIINAFTVTSDQFNASLLNKSIIFFLKNVVGTTLAMWLFLLCQQEPHVLTCSSESVWILLFGFCGLYKPTSELFRSWVLSCLRAFITVFLYISSFSSTNVSSWTCLPSPFVWSTKMASTTWRSFPWPLNEQLLLFPSSHTLLYCKCSPLCSNKNIDPPVNYTVFFILLPSAICRFSCFPQQNALESLLDLFASHRSWQRGKKKERHALILSLDVYLFPHCFVHKCFCTRASVSPSPLSLSLSSTDRWLINIKQSLSPEHTGI